jgi:hypothetical protein
VDKGKAIALKTKIIGRKVDASEKRGLFRDPRIVKEEVQTQGTRANKILIF